MSESEDTVAELLMQMVQNMQPFIEAAEGQRHALEASGWSPTAAEAYALELLLGMTRACFATGTK